jgi:hypothetical protein
VLKPFTICGPSIHELAALLKSITPSVGPLDSVTNEVAQRRLRDLTREVGLLPHPVPEG